jgi:hypothetical protein
MKLTYWLTTACAVVLLLTGVSKLIDGAGNNPLLLDLDPVIPFLTTRQLMLVVGCIEVVLAVYIFRSHLISNRSMAVLWFVCMVSAYKICAYCMHARRPCSCLGFVGRAMKLSTIQMDRLTWLILAVLAILAVPGILASVKRPESPAVVS